MSYARLQGTDSPVRHSDTERGGIADQAREGLIVKRRKQPAEIYWLSVANGMSETIESGESPMAFQSNCGWSRFSVVSVALCFKV